jgi:hypothetical protein
MATWARSLPEVSPAVSRLGETISLRACDPGAAAEIDLTGQGARAMVLPASRTFMAADELARGQSAGQARCYADELLRRYTIDELEAIDAPADVEARASAADAACSRTA